MGRCLQQDFPTYVMPLESYDGQLGDMVDSVYEGQLEEYQDDCRYNSLHGMPLDDPPEPDWGWAETLLREDAKVERIMPFQDVLEGFNADLDFHEVVMRPQDVEVTGDLCYLDVVIKGDGVPFDYYDQRSQIMIAGNRMAGKAGSCDHDWSDKRLIGAVLKEGERIRDWLYEVPEQFGFELRRFPSRSDKYDSFRAMSFGRKPRGRRC